VQIEGLKDRSGIWRAPMARMSGVADNLKKPQCAFRSMFVR
jgi:hypothetical protein